MTHMPYAQPREALPWTDDIAAARRGLGSSKGLIFGAMMRVLADAKGAVGLAKKIANELYGERHPVAESVNKALIAGVGSSGGFIVPPEQSAELIELLRPKVAVRAANPILMPMPRGTMTLPAQTSAAVATYGSEHMPAPQTQPGLGQIVASYKKLKALVPISNDLLRFADPGADAMVRNDLIKVMALRQDLAFLFSDGTSDSPRGFATFANIFAKYAGINGSGTGGVSAVYSSSSPSTWGVGGNFVTSSPVWTANTIVAELTGLIAKLATANVQRDRQVFFMHPRAFWTLANLMNSLGVLVFPTLAEEHTLWGFPVIESTQIPINIVDPTGAYPTCSFVFLVEMTDVLLLDSLQTEIAVSKEATYVDSAGVTQNAFSNDETVVRAIAEHDLQMRHKESIAVLQGVTWSPTFS